MRSVNCKYIVLLLAVLVFCAGSAAKAGPGIKVEPIDATNLGKLLTEGDNRLVLNFMAAWCGPCIDELPYLNKLYKMYKHKGLKVVGISIDYDGPGAIQPILNSLKIEFPVYWCGENAIEKFELNAIPMLLFVKRGKIVERLHGKRPEKFLDDKIKEFLKE